MSVRELNKQRTRQAISRTATRMFLTHGFDKVTIADIAAAAGVSKMTVTNYFPRKEDLLFDIAEDLVAGPARTVTDRAPGESAWAALRRAWLEALDRHDNSLGFSSPAFARLVCGSPVLGARLREIQEQRENALAAVLAADTGTEPDDPAPRLAAAQLDAIPRMINSEVFRRTAAGEDNTAIADRLRPLVQQGFDRLEPGLGGYAIRAEQR